MTTTAPTRAQSMAHLELANQVRTYRAQLRAKVVEKGPKVLRDVIARPPYEMQTATVIDTLKMGHRVGNARARKMCRMAHLAPLTTLGSMDEDEREALMRAVHEVLGR